MAINGNTQTLNNKKKDFMHYYRCIKSLFFSFYSTKRDKNEVNFQK